MRTRRDFLLYTVIIGLTRVLDPGSGRPARDPASCGVRCGSVTRSPQKNEIPKNKVINVVEQMTRNTQVTPNIYELLQHAHYHGPCTFKYKRSACAALAEQASPEKIWLAARLHGLTAELTMITSTSRAASRRTCPSDSQAASALTAAAAGRPFSCSASWTCWRLAAWRWAGAA